MTVTAEELERLRDGVARFVPDDAGVLWWRTTEDGPNLSFREVAALAIHGLNCQAAGITAERLAMKVDGAVNTKPIPEALFEGITARGADGLL